MKVFVSWSGDRGKAVASELKHWLPLVFRQLDVWMSDQDIYAGKLWGNELGQALGECKLGIICLTAESLDSRWQLFEAGALSTSIAGSRVIPYRFQLQPSDIGPPLSQFQGVGADKEGTFSLVRSINDALDKQLPDEAMLSELYESLWPRLESKLRRIQHVEQAQIRSDRELLEEILDLARHASIKDLNMTLGQLLASPNIVRVEVAPKQVAGSETSTLALRFVVTKKQPVTEVIKEQLIPPSIFGMPTDVVEDA